MKKLIAKLFGLYTKDQMVTFGLYILSDKRKELIRKNSNSETEFEMKFQVVHDADLDNWRCI